jgi:hypothetical protein
MPKTGIGKNAKRGAKVAQEKVRHLVIDFLKKKKGTQRKAAELFGLSLNGVQRIWSVVYKVVKKLQASNRLRFGN